MDHADVLGRLESAFTGPGKLAALDVDHSVDGQELRRHIETCAACRSELHAWELTGMALAAATPDTLRAPAEARGRVLAAVAATGVPRGAAARRDATAGATAPGAAARGQAAPLTAATAPAAATPAAAAFETAPAAAAFETAPGAGPSSVADLPALMSAPVAPLAAGTASKDEDARLYAGRIEPVTGSAEAGSARPLLTALPGGAASRGEPPAGRSRASAAGLRFSRLALAAAAAVVLFVAGSLLGEPLGLTPQGQETDLTAVVNAADSILQQPGHAQVTLKTAAGQAAGTALLDPASNQIVVISQGLDAAGGRHYGCWVVRGAQDTWIGQMNFQGATAYWSGTVTTPAGLGKPGDIIQVRVEGATGAPTLSGTI